MATLSEIKQKLTDNGFECYTVRQGVLQDDEIWVHDDTRKAIINNTHEYYKSFVFKEKYLNEWSSDQTIRGYNKLPKKYYKYVGLA